MSRIINLPQNISKAVCALKVKTNFNFINSNLVSWTWATGQISESVCSDHSARRGKGQKVIAVSFHQGQDLELLKKNAKVINHFYNGGHVFRIYHNITKNDKNYSILCELFCQNDSLVFKISN